MLDYYLKYPKKQNKRMKPLESKDPDLFTISVQFLSEFAWNLQNIVRT
jgi:hypothetical protein